MAKLGVCILIFCVSILSTTCIANRNTITSTSESGVCFYGKTAERVLSILASGKYRNFIPDHKKQIRDCSDLNPKHHKSGVYKVGGDKERFEVYCEMRTDVGDYGGWTVFQNRFNGKIDFYKSWADYQKGFGNLRSEFWLGNDKLAKLTSSGKYKLRIELEDFDGSKAYAEYSTFSVGGVSTKYKLTIGDYSGTAGDSLAHHNGKPFSTKDQDNDSASSKCAVVHKGAWWYNECHDSNLNGLYLGNKSDNTGMRWHHWKKSQSMKSTKMMILKN